MRNRVPSNISSTSLKQRMQRGWIPFNNQLNQARLSWYAFAKQIPDLLTMLRLIMAALLLAAGLIDGQANPARDIWLLVIAWTTDMADGRIARSLKKEHRLVGFRFPWPASMTRRYEAITGLVADYRAKNTSWLGQNDVYVDMFVSVAVLAYMTVTAMLPLWVLLVYLVVWGLVFLRWGIPDILAQVFQNPIYAAFVYLTVRDEPAVLPWLLLWALIALIFFWRRMVQLLKNILHTIFFRNQGEQES